MYLGVTLVSNSKYLKMKVALEKNLKGMKIWSKLHSWLPPEVGSADPNILYFKLFCVCLHIVFLVTRMHMNLKCICVKVELYLKLLKLLSPVNTRSVSTTTATDPSPWVHPHPWPKLLCNFRSARYFPWCYILFLYFLWPQEADWALLRPQESYSIRTISKLSQALPRHVFSFPFPFSNLSCFYSLMLDTFFDTINPTFVTTSILSSYQLKINSPIVRQLTLSLN